MKTRAAILVEQHKPLVLADIDVPEPTFGQVLVKLHYTGICGSQIGEIDGKRLAKLQDFYFANKIIRKKTPVNELYTNQFVK